MTELIDNLEQSNVQELRKKWAKRNEMNVVDVAEVVSKFITTLKEDHDKGRPKNLGTISVQGLGKELGVGQGVISQYMSVWKMPQESKDFLRNYNLSLINAYYVSRTKGKDEAETVKLQKEAVIEKNTSPSMGTGKRKDILLHTINEAQMILNGIITSYKIPKETFQIFPTQDPKFKGNHEEITLKANTCIKNIEQAINYLSPKIQKLPFFKKELEFCSLMLENNVVMFCGAQIGKDCLEKQISFIAIEIQLIEQECKLPHIASLIMMKNNLEKNI